MKWLEALIKHPGEMLALGLALSRGLVCNPGDNPNCKNILAEIRTMSDTIILDYGDYDVMFPPAMYCEGEFLDHIFAVPEKNSVGTNDIDNAISILRFRGEDKIDRVTVKKDFMEMVSGPFDFRFLPVWSEKEIAYSQTRGFLLIGIPERKTEIHTIVPGLDDVIGNVAILDGLHRTFVFELDQPAAGLGNHLKMLRVIRFENDTLTVLSEHSAGLKTSSYSEPWFTYKNSIFIYNDMATRIEAFDELFQPVRHPLAEAFNANNMSFRCLQEIAVHPSLPLALLVEKGKWPRKEQLSKADSLPRDEKRRTRDLLYGEESRNTLFLFRWTHPDPKQRLVPLLSSVASVWKTYNPENSYSDFTFSPDGKWVVFRDRTEDSQNPVFVTVPIDENNPLLLGRPIKLGRTMRDGASGPTGTAWTTGPISFVMCDGAVLYKWDLENMSGLRRETVRPGTADPWNRSGE